MDAALVFTWTKVIPTREKIALEYAAEAMEFFEKKATDGRCTKLDWFFSSSAPFFFTMVKGEYDYLIDLIDSDDFQVMVAKGALLLDDYHYYIFQTEDRADAFISEWGTVGSELGILV